MTTFVDPELQDMEDDDEEPIRFKRTNTSKPIALKSEPNSSSSQKRDGLAGRQTNITKLPNSQNHKDKRAPSTAKALPGKSPLVSSRSQQKTSPLISPRASPLPSKTLPATTAIEVTKPSASAVNQPNILNQCRISKSDMEEKPPVSNPKNESDSEDDKLLDMLPGSSNRNSNHCNKLAGSSTSAPKAVSPENEDPDDTVPLARRINVKSLNSQNHKDKRAPSTTKTSPGKSPLISPSSSAKTSPLISPRASPLPSKTLPATTAIKVTKPSASASNQPNILNQCRINGSDMEEKPPVSYPENESDSEDDKLLVKLPAFSNRNSSHLNKVAGSSTLAPDAVSPESDDSDDNMPLASRIKVKSDTEISNLKSSGSNKDKHLMPKCQENGSAFSTVPSKRSLAEVKSSSQSLDKKPRLSESSAPVKGNKPSVKAEKKEYDDEDHFSLSQRIKKSPGPVNKSSSTTKATAVASSSHKITKNKLKVEKKSKCSQSSMVPPSSGEGIKWNSLVHNGVSFPPPYKPHGVKMLYKGKPVDLTPEQEEVATMYAVMLDTDYMNKPQFKENFMNDWKKLLGRNHVIQSLEHCDFRPIYEWHQKEKEKKKQMSSEEKKALKEEKMKQEEKYTWAILDGVKEKVGNFRVEPPGLFRGRGEHPKMGKLKKRILPSDITINIGKDAPIPECPIPGERWKEIRHDNTVTWLAFWNDPINPKEVKYVFLAASSTLKGLSDKEKYDKARLLTGHIDRIRAAYTKDFHSKDPVKRQIAVATYLIDKLALRAGNEKDEEEADTVGCCTLKVNNVEPEPPNKLKFDFLGKDSIRYENVVAVEEPVFKAIQKFREGKKGDDDLFDLLDTTKLNAHLKGLMPGLTAKVFRTYNASITLQNELNRLTLKGTDVAEKIAVYQIANKQVAIICNHQRSVPKTHDDQITRLRNKIEELKGVLDELEDDLTRTKKGKPLLPSKDGKAKRNLAPEMLQKKIDQTNAKIEKMEKQIQIKDDMKTVALGTSKTNYLDPRISVAWCKQNEVPIEKIFNKSLLAKFAWAMDVEPDYSF